MAPFVCILQRGQGLNGQREAKLWCVFSEDVSGLHKTKDLTADKCKQFLRNSLNNKGKASLKITGWLHLNLIFLKHFNLNLFIKEQPLCDKQ